MIFFYEKHMKTRGIRYSARQKKSRELSKAHGIY